MANPKRTVLGVEIGAREVRMVEMRGGAPQPQILKAGKVALPPGAMDGDRIVQVEVVADLIRGLHNRLGCQARAAIIGMGIQSVVTRTFAIPRVPDSELRTVIEGELSHYQILRSGTGAFDFFRIETSSASADTPHSALIMAVEERIAQGYRLTIEKAGLQMIALEPITLSLYRAAFSQLETQPAALCLAVTPQRSELSVLDHSQLRLYRRLDIGSNDFIVGRKGGAAGGPAGTGTVNLGDSPPSGSGTRPILLNTDADTAELPSGSLPPGATLGGTGPLSGGTGPLGGGTGPLSGIEGGSYGDIIPQAAASLANEVQRSLDFYRRENPNSTAIARIILTTNDPDAEALSERLAQDLRMDVRVAEIPTNPALPPQTVKQLEAPQGLSFLGAAGAAMHALTPDWKQVPRFNLSVGGQSDRPASLERDRLTAMFIFSACILIGGIVFAVIFNQKAEITNHGTDIQVKVLGGTKIDVEQKRKALQEQKALESIVKADNLPVPDLLDTVAGAMPQNSLVGLSNISFARDGKISIDGTAKDTAAYTTFVLGLLSCSKVLAPPSMGNYTVDPTTNIVHFKVDTALLGTQAERALTGGPQGPR